MQKMIDEPVNGQFEARQQSIPCTAPMFFLMGSEQPYTTGLFLPINQTTSSYYANEQHAYENYHVVVAPLSCPEN